MPFKDRFKRLFFYLLYLGNPPWDTGISPPELLAFIESHPPGKALDLGCGSGTNAITLAKHGWEVSGVDFVGKAIRTARRKAEKEGVKVKFFQDDVTRLKNIQGQYDLILDIGCFHSLSQNGKKQYVENLRRLLANDGTVLMYAFFREGESGNGLLPEDLELLDNALQLVQREYGSERGRRTSAWSTYRKKGSRSS